MLRRNVEKDATDLRTTPMFGPRDVSHTAVWLKCNVYTANTNGL